MLFLQPMLVNARALLEGLFPRSLAATAGRRGALKPVAPASSASEVAAIGVPEECAAPPAGPRLEAELVLRRVRHFHEDKERG